MYKLVACDVDGTLNNDNDYVSAENLSAIKKLGELGLEFVPITGRTLSELEEVLNIPQVRYVIYSNGAAIYDKKTDTNTYMCISKEIAKDLFELLLACECYIIVHYGGKTYERPYANYEELKRYNINPIVCKLIEIGGEIIEDFEEFVFSLDLIESITAFFRNDEDLERCKAILEKDRRLFFATTWEHNIEIFSIEAGKKKALTKLSDMLDIGFENIIALGDGENDAQMLKEAGLGLCASNGSEKAKKAADKIICSNNEHVVEYTLDNFILE